MLSATTWQHIFGGLYRLRHSIRNEIGADVDEQPYLEACVADIERVLHVIQARQEVWSTGLGGLDDAGDARAQEGDAYA